MELYKLYCILKWHTGYEAMIETMREFMFPEVYAERRRKARQTLAQIAVLNALLNTERWLE